MKLLNWLETKKWYIRVVLAVSLVSSLIVIQTQKDNDGIIALEANTEDKTKFILFILLWLITAISFYLLVTISAFGSKEKGDFQKKWDKTFWVIFTLSLPVIFYMVGYKVLYIGLINS